MTTQKSGLAAVLAAITGAQPKGDAIPRADHMTAIETAVTQAFGEGETAGSLAAATLAVTAERTRVKAIMGGDNAKGRETLASHFAFDTEMSAEAANAALAAAPKTADPGKTSRLDALMPGNNPSLKEPGTSSDADDPGAALSASMDRLLKSRGLVPVSH